MSLDRIVFLLPRALLVMLYLPLAVLLAAWLIFPPAQLLPLRLVLGILFVLGGVHLLLFRRCHAIEHADEMLRRADEAPPVEERLYRNALTVNTLHHLYAYGGVLLTFIGLLFILA